MFRISKKFKFDAAHQLQNLPEGHKCGNLHGHTYTVEVVLESETVTDLEAWVVDFGELSFIKEFIDTKFDHKNLNEEFGGQTTSENLARFFYEFVEARFDTLYNVKVAYVRVSETEATWAEYSA